MADLISAEDGALRQGANAVASAHAAITQKRNTVNESVHSSGSWDSPAGKDFIRLMDSWHEKAGDLLTTLARLEEALGGAEKDQAANEDQSQQTISGLGSAMSGI